MKILLICPAIFFILPGLELVIPSINLDSSWTIALQLAVENGLSFGRDFIFTYGPLGFVGTRVAAESTKNIIIAYDVFLTLQFILIPFYVLWLAPSLRSLVVLFTVYFTLGCAYYLQDPAVTLFLLSTFWIFYDKYKFSYLAFILAVLDALLAFYVKVNLGLAALLQVFAVVLLSLAISKKYGPGFLRLFTIFIALIVSTFLVDVAFWGYLRASLHIANGFNDAMYLNLTSVKPLYEAVALIVILLLVGAVGILIGKHWLLVVSCFGFTFLLFKQAFVRADEHYYVFFDYISIPFALLALYSERRLRAFNMVMFFAVSVFILANKNLSLTVFENRYVSVKRYLQSFERDYAKVEVNPPLSTTLVGRIGSNTVDLMPDNISLLYYSKLNYFPRPIIQSYLAYDGYLDLINASFIRSSGAQKVVLSHGCIDYRFCLYDETETKIALLENYELEYSEGDLLLLSRKNTPTPFKRTLIKKGTHRLKSEFKIKDTGSLQVIKFFIDYSQLGRLVRFVYKPAPLRQILKSNNGRSRYRAVVPILQAGVIANLNITDGEALKKLFSGDIAGITPVQSIRFQTDKNWAYEQEFDYEVYELTK